MKVYLLIYDSESDCDDLVGVYSSQDGAIQKAIMINKEMCECEVGSCDCDKLTQDYLTTKSMDWGPALRVGSFYYVIEKEVHLDETIETTEERFDRIEGRLDELEGEISHLQK